MTDSASTSHLERHRTAFPLTNTTIDPETHHWTPQVQRAFLEALAVEGSVRGACRIAGKSWRTAYGLRMQGRGAAFALGWDGAVLIARARLADELMERAFEGQEESMTRSGDTITRHRHDNRLAMSLLSRLDRMAEAPCAPDNDTGRARIVAEDFQAFLDLIESGGDRDAALAFITARTPALPASEPAKIEATGQCDLLSQALLKEQGYSSIAERAKAMGFWFDHRAKEWKTSFPRPEGFDGDEEGSLEDEDYERDLDEAEEDQLERARAKLNADIEAAGRALRDEFFYREAYSDEEWERLGTGG
jgi:hypothetical protein